MKHLVQRCPYENPRYQKQKRIPHKDIKLPPWWLDALERGDVERIKRYAQFCLHSKRKFEKAADREYYRNVKLREQLQDNGIAPNI